MLKLIILKKRRILIMNKFGNITEETRSDFDSTKKVEFIDKEGFEVADKKNKNKLKNPVAIKETK